MQFLVAKTLTLLSQGTYTNRYSTANIQRNIRYRVCFLFYQLCSPVPIPNQIDRSADFWLASNECDVSQCGSVPRYNVTASNSSVDLNSSFTIRYGQGTASGELYNDTVILAGRNLTQGFAACSAVSQDLLSGNVSGIMGLGFELLAQSKITPFWQNYFQTLASQNLTSQYAFPGFAFSLSRFINVTDAEDLEPGGVFSLGTLNNASFTGPINWIDLPDPEEASYWYIPMDAVMFNSTPVPGINTNETRVAMDTGTTLIGGPSDVVAAIYSNIPGAQQASGDYEGVSDVGVLSI